MAPSVSPVPDRDAILLDLGAGILEALRQRDTDHPVFHGCIDWHSSVHGHWALLRNARATGEGAEGARFSHESMTKEGILAEARNLRADPRFEMPYGRAWFLRLALEHDRWLEEAAGGEPTPLGDLAKELAGSLLDTYAGQTPVPSTREYAGDSWALVQLFAYFRRTRDEEGLETVQRHIKTGFLGRDIDLTLGEDADRPEFFSRFGNWAYLIARTQDRETLGRFLDEHPVKSEDLAPLERLLDHPHHLGMNWSRAWALRALSRRAPGEADRRRFDRAFLDHVVTGMYHHRVHKDRYRAYGHWVPQFAVYALTEGD